MAPEAYDRMQQREQYLEAVAAGLSDAVAGLAKRIRRATARLARHPESGRRGKLPGIRALVIARAPYLAPYRVHGDRIELLRVLHGRRPSPAGD
ncbi:MAG: type II toxin-antitoxin system RelE/ParE family toxin [Acidobacteria bacterium]|nr:type II toxin-antitoxin system RelE/ParE family toxin [Acidobacteriota bacterium]